MEAVRFARPGEGLYSGAGEPLHWGVSGGSVIPLPFVSLCEVELLADSLVSLQNQDGMI